MPIESHAVSHFELGIVLDVVADDLPLRAYVAVRPPDPECVIAFVPPGQFENGANLHVAAVASTLEAPGTVEDVLFNVDPNDAVAFLCADEDSWLAVLEALGYSAGPAPLE